MSKYVTSVSMGDCERITPGEFYGRLRKEKKRQTRMEKEPVVDTFEQTVPNQENQTSRVLLPSPGTKSGKSDFRGLVRK